MTLRKKSLFIVVLTTAALILVLFAVLQNLLLAGFAEVERQDAAKNVERALNALSASLTSLDSKTGDWANWDDAYQFVQDGNSAFIQTNPTDDSFRQLQIDFMAFVNTSSQIVYSKGYNPDSQQGQPFPSSLAQFLSPGSTLLQNGDTPPGIKGILVLPEGTLLLSARPILTSQGQGPSHGTLVFARWLDTSLVQSLEKTTNLTWTIERWDNAGLPDDFQAARSALSEEAADFVQPLNGQTVAGYIRIKDLTRNPALLLRVSMPRPIYQQALATMRYILFSLLGIGVAFGTAAQVAVDRLIRSWQVRRESEERFRAVAQSSNDGIIIVDVEGRVVYWNQGAQRMFLYTDKEMLGQSLVRLLPEQLGTEYQRALAEGQVTEAGRGRRMTYEGVGLRKDKSEFPFETSFAAWHASERKFFSFTVRDITERKRSEAAEHEQRTLAEAQRDTAAALNSTLDFQEVLERILDNIGRVVPHDLSSIMLVEGDVARVVHWRAARPPEDAKTVPEIRMSIAKVPVLQRMIQTRRPIIVPDVRRDDDWVEIPEAPWIRSHICVPISVKGEVIGILNLDSHNPNFFTPDYGDRLQTFADQAASAIQNARLFAETQGRLQHLRALREIDQAISSSLDLNLTLDVVLKQVANQLVVDAADILLLNPFTHTLNYSAGTGFHSSALTHTKLRLGEGLAGRAALERRVVSALDLAEDANGLRRSPLLEREGFLSYYGVPLLAKGQVKGVLEIFHRTGLAPLPEWLELMEALAGQAAIAIDSASLFTSLQRSNVDLELAYDTTLEGWTRALDLRDKETEGHTERVTDMAVRLAGAMGFGDAELVQVRRGALLHDIGKMGIPDAILLKPGPLTEEEWVIMHKHPQYAYELLSPIAYLRPALDIPYCHHEKWDGRGYPRGLEGDQIPLPARIFAVVDVWDALCSDRPYRARWPEDKVRAYIRSLSGIHFDPQVVEVILRILDESDEKRGGSGLPESQVEHSHRVNSVAS